MLSPTARELALNAARITVKHTGLHLVLYILHSCRYRGPAGIQRHVRALQISAGGKTTSLGDHDTEEEAARAFDRAAINKGSLQAKTNFNVMEYAAELDQLTCTPPLSHLRSSSTVCWHQRRQQPKQGRVMSAHPCPRHLAILCSYPQRFINLFCDAGPRRAESAVAAAENGQLGARQSARLNVSRAERRESCLRVDRLYVFARTCVQVLRGGVPSENEAR